MAHDGSTDERRQWVVNRYWAHGATADAAELWALELIPRG
jgi:hypothetical protein